MTLAPLQLIRAVRQYPMTSLFVLPRLTDRSSFVTWALLPSFIVPINYSPTQDRSKMFCLLVLR